MVTQARTALSARASESRKDGSAVSELIAAEDFASEEKRPGG